MSGRQIVSVSDIIILTGMTWTHAVAAIVEEAADQETLGFGPFGLLVVDLFIELGLDRLKQAPIENGRLLAFKDFALESNFTDIEAIAKQMCERASRKRNAADGLAGLEGADLGKNAPLAGAHAGSVRRVAAAAIETLVIQSVRDHLKPSEPIDDRSLISTHVARVEV